MVDPTSLPSRPQPGALPPVDELKAQAKRLRQELDTPNAPLSHSRALELLARQYGFRDWNTLSAAAERVQRGHNQAPLKIGDMVAGTYLGQPFTGEVLGVHRKGDGHVRLTLHFDKPVDVVTFESFSAFRQRVSCTLDDDLTAPAKLSNGTPHMRIERRL